MDYDVFNTTRIYLYISQSVNRIVDIPTYAKAFWCKLVRINVNLIKHLTDLKHRHLAGAFFLALILYHPDIKKK